MQAPPPPALHIGCAAGFSGDRTDAAAPVVRALIASRQPACLIFETLAERTLALAQLERQRHPDAGYEPLLDDMLTPVLGDCLRHGIRIVSNFGAANPTAAARRIAHLAQTLGLRTPRIAIVWGDNLLHTTGTTLRPGHLMVAAAIAQHTARHTAPHPAKNTTPISANAYIGARPIAAALRAGADIVVAGRVADPSLTLGPAAAHFGWAWDDWDRLARATIAGHLLECGAQVTGGYFADPGFKDVPNLARVGYPIAIIDADGHCTITKPPGTGGIVTPRTVKEQLLYEVHDPAAYHTPDVVADLSRARVELTGPDTVRLTGVRGHPHNGHYKVNICHTTGWLAEGEISYAGPRALERARLAASILHERLDHPSDLRLDWIGAASVLGDDAGHWHATHLPPAAPAPPPARAPEPASPPDIRLRAAWLRPDPAQARRLTREVTALYTCGPAAGGGVRTAIHQRLGTISCLVPQADVPTGWHWLDAPPPQPDTAPPLLGTAPDTTPALYHSEHCENNGDSGPGNSGNLNGPHLTVPLYRLAHGRTGDKGNRCNISLIAWHPGCWPILREQVTAERVQAHFAARQPSQVRRYVLESIQALNLVIDDVLDGGVNDALNLDSHGKTLSYWLLDMPVQIPAGLLPELPPA